jgi:hypothetical protein
MDRPLRIGIDFDNTLASYDHLFQRIAAERGLLPAGFRGDKKRIRDTLRERESGEAEWMRLQAEVYGTRMAEAELIEGVSSFFRSCRRNGADVFVVSHKTRYAAADPEGVDLHAASLAWMEAQGFFRDDHIGLSRDRVFFEPTREAKCQRIAALGCAHFIDDLEEVFGEPTFPSSVERLLLYRGEGPLPVGKFTAFRHWDAITDALFRNA